MNKKIVIAFAAALAVLLVVAGFGYGAYAFYYQNSENAVIRGFVRTLNLPVAKVGRYTISYDEYQLTREAVDRFINSEAGKEVQAQLPPKDVLDGNILEQLIRQKMVQELADQKNVSVTDDDVRAVFSDIVAQAASSTTPDVAQYLYDNYGWHEEDFRSKVLRPALLEQKLASVMAGDAQGDQTALENALAARRGQPDVVVYLKGVTLPDYTN